MARKIKNYNEYAENTEKGAALFNQKRYDEALIIFQDLAEYNAKNFKVFETLALIYLKLNNITSAEEAYRKARTLFAEQSGMKMDMRNFSEVISELEDLETLENIYEEQTKTLEKSKDKVSHLPEVHKIPIQMGMHYMAKGEFKKAEELLVSHKSKYFS